MSITSERKHGFTLIELMIVIVIIGVLTSITMISVNGWRRSLVASQIKSDLVSVSTVMENARNFSDGYPVSVPSTFTPSENVVLSGGSYDDGATYCVDSSSDPDASLHFYISSFTQLSGPQPGTCSVAYPAPKNLVTSIVSLTSLAVSWDSVPGASLYELQYAVNDTFSSSPVSITAQATTANAVGLTTGQNYFFRVKVKVDGVTSQWSNVATGNTNVPAPPAPTVAVNLSGSNVVATANEIPPSSCLVGSVQYAFSARTNDGSWGSYGAWSTTRTSSQAGNQGTKYGYMAKSRCYSSATLYSDESVGVEATYIYQIASAPSAPSLWVSDQSSTHTRWNWSPSTCPSGASPSYQYIYYYDWGNSGWQWFGTGTTTVLSTFEGDRNFTLYVQMRCASAYSTGPWSASAGNTFYRPAYVQVLVIAGGGAGGAGTSYGNGGGGGAGGYIYNSAYQVYRGWSGVGVGAGGSSGGGGNAGNNGGNSTFGGSGWSGLITAIGGGGGGGGSRDMSGRSGGSGGGASASSGRNISGSAGTSGQGNNGGNSCESGRRTAGGGGGATGGNYYFNGGCLSGTRSGDGGTGAVSSITGSSVCYAAGGGGGIGNGTEGYGGTSQQNGAGIGCGAGRAHETYGGDSASSSTGSGGGGGKGSGGNGGSGIVVIRYVSGHIWASGGNSSYSSGSDWVHVFTGNGTFTVN
jgi:prepilin-type N-terminal cleavage/methylation domain-containing protein